MSGILTALGVVGGLVIGAAIVYFWMQGRVSSKTTTTQADVDGLLAQAQAQQKEIILEAKDEAHTIRSTAEQDARERRAEVQRMERRIQQKEENLDAKLEQLERRERQLSQREEEIERHRATIDELIAEQRRELERVSELTHEEATEMLLRSIE